MTPEKAFIGFTTSPGLERGRSLVTTRSGFMTPGSELHLFCGDTCTTTSVAGVSESELRISWNRSIWTLAPWQPGDPEVPPVEDDGSKMIEFWTVRRVEAGH